VLIIDFVFPWEVVHEVRVNANGGTRVRQLDTVRGKIWGMMTMTLESWSIEDVVLCGLYWCKVLPSKLITNTIMRVQCVGEWCTDFRNFWMPIIIVEPNQEMKYKEKFSKKYYLKK
jgi:hypothetical protein